MKGCKSDTFLSQVQSLVWVNIGLPRAKNWSKFMKGCKSDTFLSQVQSWVWVNFGLPRAKNWSKFMKGCKLDTFLSQVQSWIWEMVSANFAAPKDTAPPPRFARHSKAPAALDTYQFYSYLPKSSHFFLEFYFQLFIVALFKHSKYSLGVLLAIGFVCLSVCNRFLQLAVES